MANGRRVFSVKFTIEIFNQKNIFYVKFRTSLQSCYAQGIGDIVFFQPVEARKSKKQQLYYTLNTVQIHGIQYTVVCSTSADEPWIQSSQQEPWIQSRLQPIGALGLENSLYFGWLCLGHCGKQYCYAWWETNI